jgi:hypothetical protein
MWPHFSIESMSVLDSTGQRFAAPSSQVAHPRQSVWQKMRRSTRLSGLLCEANLSGMRYIVGRFGMM